MLEAQHLMKVYKPKRGIPVKALDDVSIRLPDTGMVFILGKSGSGKSTLLNVLGGLDKYDSGKIIIKGMPSDDFKQKHFDSYRNTYIGFIFQEYNILEEFSIGANIALAIELQGRKATSEQINEILAKVDLAGMGNRKPNELSGGQKQRVAIARALVKNPQIIMADEPTGALDSKTGKQVFDTLKELSREKLVVIVSHDREFSEQYADRIIELADGKIISDVEYSGASSSLSEEKGLNFKESEIEIPEDYVLTKDDMDAINDYLRQKRSGHRVRLGIVSHGKKQGGGVFVDTDESKIPYHDGKDFQLIKSKLPLKNAAIMGASSLGHKKFRLVLTIFLSVIAFALFALATTVATYDYVDTSAKSFIDSDIKYLTLAKEVKFKNWTTSYNMTDDDLSKLKEDTKLNFIGVLSAQADYSENIYSKEKFGGFATTRLTNCISLTQSDLDSFGYTMLAGKLPENENEIAISEYTFELFKKGGYVDSGAINAEKIDINSASDLVGKTLNITISNDSFECTKQKFKITGIIDTGFDFDRYKDYIFPEKEEEATIIDWILSMEMSEVMSNSATGNIIVSKKLYDKLLGETVPQMNLGNYFNGYGYRDMSDAIGYSSYSFGDSPVVFSNLKKDGYFFFDSTKTELDKYDVLVSAGSFANVLYHDLLKEPEFGDDEITAKEIQKILSDAEFSDEYSLYTEDDVRSMFSTESSYYYSYVCSSMERKWDFAEETGNKYFEKTSDAELQFLINNNVFGLGSSTVEGIRNDESEYNFKYSYYNALIDNGFSFVFVKQLWDEGKIDEIKNGWKASGMLNSDDSVINFKIVGICSLDNPYGVCLSTEFIDSLDIITPGKYCYATAPMPSSEKSIQEVISYADTGYENGKISFSVHNSVSYILDQVRDLLDTLGEVFFWVGFAFAVFASLMMFNFITTSISYKKREIGILRAIGSRSNDVFRIFFAESFFIAIINFLLATIGTVAVTIILNSVLRNEYGLTITLLRFGILQILLLLAVSVGVAFISSFLPVKRIASKKPIDAIRSL